MHEAIVVKSTEDESRAWIIFRCPQCKNHSLQLPAREDVPPEGAEIGGQKVWHMERMAGKVIRISPTIGCHGGFFTEEVWCVKVVGYARTLPEARELAPDQY